MVSESVQLSVSRADSWQKNLNLESQEYWIFEQSIIPTISKFGRMFRKLQKQDDSGKIEILILILSVFLFSTLF